MYALTMNTMSETAAKSVSSHRSVHRHHDRASRSMYEGYPPPLAAPSLHPGRRSVPPSGSRPDTFPTKGEPVADLARSSTKYPEEALNVRVRTEVAVTVEVGAAASRA